MEMMETGQNAAGDSERKRDQEIQRDQDQECPGVCLLRRRDVEEVQRRKAQESQGAGREDPHD